MQFQIGEMGSVKMMFISIETYRVLLGLAKGNHPDENS